MPRKNLAIPVGTLLLAIASVLAAAACESAGEVSPPRVAAEGALARRSDHAARVMTSAFCAGCHPAIYAEHEQNTHGRAFTDEEVRLATGRFGHGDCIRCHTPRPIFETGIGMNPIRRYHNLTEGNTCMTCHFKQGYDYTSFAGGEECAGAFDDRVGEVEACASCHRNHGTPYQWERAPTGKAAGRVCMTCHMPMVRRPVAVGEPPKLVRSHAFPGARSEEQVRKAYEYDARIEGNEVVVEISNVGAGHHFPTELKQRAVESLIVVRDPEGNEVSRSRLVFRDPYKRPYGLKLPVNTQIPPGETREHRVPLKVPAGTADCELHFKLYFPIEDHHPDLARQLEARRLVFEGVTPSEQEVESALEVAVRVPEAITAEAASPANLVDFARPPIGTVEVEVPEGDGPADVVRLVELFQFPVPEANRLAQARLVEIGAPALPALVDALGSWDNKTFKQAKSVLMRIGAPALPALVDAAQLSAPERNSFDFNDLYLRYHARQLLTAIPGLEEPELREVLEPALSMPNALDRRSAAEALGARRVAAAAPALRGLLDDRDPDVVAAAAKALARIGDRSAVEPIERALDASYFVETERDLSVALAELGSAAGIPTLLAGLDLDDALLRESYFESLFAVTGVHLGYDPLAPRPERLAAIAALQTWWAEDGGPEVLRRPHRPDVATHERAWKLVSELGAEDGGSGEEEPGEGAADDRAAIEQLVAMGDDAVPALVLGLNNPPGFAARRARVCEALGRIGSADAAPALMATLRDPVISVAAWACWALESTGDEAVLGALRRYVDRLQSLAAKGMIPASAGSVDLLVAQASRTRLLLGDELAREQLVRLLLSEDAAARRTAIGALEAVYGERRGYDPDAEPTARRRAAARWSEPDAVGSGADSDPDPDRDRRD